MSEVNKQIARNYFRDFATGHVPLEKYYAEDAVIHGLASGSEDVSAFATMLHAVLSAFSNIEEAVHLSLADGDYVTTLATVTLTHTGEYMGIPASGKRFTAEEIHIYRFAAGKIVERWSQSNFRQRFMEAVQS